MKKLIFSSLSALILLTAFAPSTKAQGLENATDGVQQGEQYAEKQMSPFDLVSAAYEGRFKDLGIPGYGQLEDNYDTDQVTAKDLINAGIKMGELSPQAANDEEYINNVDAQLNELQRKN